MKREQQTNKGKTIQHKHCPNCCHYVDGFKEKNNDDTVRFHSQPGMRYYRKTEGNIYDKVGYGIPCDCPAGIEIRRQRNDELEQIPF